MEGWMVEWRMDGWKDGWRVGWMEDGSMECSKTLKFGIIFCMAKKMKVEGKNIYPKER
jgi:hypothetical protein